MSRRREDFSSSSSSSSSLLRPLRLHNEEEPTQYNDGTQLQTRKCSVVGQEQQQQEQQHSYAQEMQQQVQQQKSYYSTDTMRRTCFICLEGPKRSKIDPSKRRDLHSCCTQCFVVVHKNCWAAYRRRQQLATFRARLLGQRAPTPHLCSICRTGRAGVKGDAPLGPRGGKRRRRSAGRTTAAEDRAGEAATGEARGGNSTVLQEELLASLGRLLQEDDEDADRPPLCTGICMCVNTGLLVVVLLLDLLLMAFTYVYPLQVLLVSLFLCYNAIILQILILAIQQRREYMRTYLAAETQDLESGGGDSDASSSSGSSGGQGGHEEELQTHSGAADNRGGQHSYGEEEYNLYAGEESEEDDNTHAAGSENTTSSSPGQMLRSMFLSLSSGIANSRGWRRHRNSSNSSEEEGRQERRDDGISSEGGHRGHNRSSTPGRLQRGSSGSRTREAFLSETERTRGGGGADRRIGELWTTAKRFCFSMLRDAWGWTERNTAAVGDTLATTSQREIEILQDPGREINASHTTAEYYTRAEAAVESHLPADVEMQVLHFGVVHDITSASRESQQVPEIFAQSS